jgi:hypothetical protein
LAAASPTVATIAVLDDTAGTPPRLTSHLREPPADLVTIIEGMKLSLVCADPVSMRFPAITGGGES